MSDLWKACRAYIVFGNSGSNARARSVIDRITSERSKLV